MKKSIVIFGLMALCSAVGLLQAGPVGIGILNKSGSAMVSKAYYAIGGETPEENTPANSIKGYNAELPGLQRISIRTKTWWGFGKNEEHLLDISSYQTGAQFVFDGTRIIPYSEYSQAQKTSSSQKLAAQLAVAERFAKTKTWFSNLWKSFKKAVTNLVTRAAPVTPTPTVIPTPVTKTSMSQIPANTTIKFKNESQTPIALGSTNPRLYIPPGDTSRSYLLLNSLRHGNLSIYTGYKDNNQNFEIIKAFECGMQEYIDWASSDHKNDELLIIFTGDKDSIRIKTQWQNPYLVIQNKSSKKIGFSPSNQSRLYDIVVDSRVEFPLEKISSDALLGVRGIPNQSVTVDITQHTQTAKYHRGEDLYIEVTNSTTAGHILAYTEPKWIKKTYITPKIQPTPVKQKLIIKNESNFKILYTRFQARTWPIDSGKQDVWDLSQNVASIEFAISDTPTQKITADITVLLKDAPNHPGKNLYIEVKNSESPQRIGYEAKWVNK